MINLYEAFKNKQDSKLEVYTSFILLFFYCLGIFTIYTYYFKKENEYYKKYTFNNNNLNYINLGHKINIIDKHNWKNNIYICNVHFQEPTYLTKFSYTYLISTYNVNKISEINMTLLHKNFEDSLKNKMYKYNKDLSTLFYITNKKNNKIYLIANPKSIYSKLNTKYGESNMNYSVEFHLRKLN